ncbi:MAG: hypothetical protein JWP04_1035 [Belnapia sp.]|nr:hypothetical protein [Belnapia sp.]
MLMYRLIYLSHAVSPRRSRLSTRVVAFGTASRKSL